MYRAEDITPLTTDPAVLAAAGELAPVFDDMAAREEVLTRFFGPLPTELKQAAMTLASEINTDDRLRHETEQRAQDEAHENLVAIDRIRKGNLKSD